MADGVMAGYCSGGRCWNEAVAEERRAKERKPGERHVCRVDRRLMVVGLRPSVDPSCGIMRGGRQV